MAIEYQLIDNRKYCECTVRALTIAQYRFRKAGKLGPNESIFSIVTQGGYRNGATTASRGSHDRGGVVDVKFAFVDNDSDQVIWAECGIYGARRYSWEFTTTETPNHGHCVVEGCPHLAEAARDQIVKMRNGYSAMASGARWRGKWTKALDIDVAWAKYQAELKTEGELSMADITTLRAEIKALRDEVAAIPAKTVSSPINYSTGPVALNTEIAQLRYKIAAVGSQVAGLHSAIEALAAAKGVVDVPALLKGVEEASARGAQSALSEAEFVVKLGEGA